MSKVFVRNYKTFEAINVKEIEEEVEGTTLRRVISQEQGAKNFIMDIFELEPGGYSQYHSHPWEHEIFVIKGNGVVVVPDGERPFNAGDVIFIPPDDPHQIKNTGSSQLEFVCLIPRGTISQHYLKKKLPPHRLMTWLATEIQSDLKFQTDGAEQIFKYLVKQFVDDYMLSKVVLDKAGWRSFPQLIKSVGLKWSTVYGSKGKFGRPLEELSRRGLIESRMFPQERGRGGTVTRVRISYDKETVKNYVDKTVKMPTAII